MKSEWLCNTWPALSNAFCLRDPMSNTMISDLFGVAVWSPLLYTYCVTLSWPHIGSIFQTFPHENKLYQHRPQTTKESNWLFFSIGMPQLMVNCHRQILILWCCMERMKSILRIFQQEQSLRFWRVELWLGIRAGSIFHVHFTWQVWDGQIITRFFHLMN